MKLLFLGSGTSHGVPMIGCECAVCRSADPHNNRTRASALLRVGAASILIDASADLRQQVLRHGVRRIDAVLLTHAHADHVLGLDDLRAFCAMQKAVIPIHGPADALAVVRRNMDYVFHAAHGTHGEHHWEVPRLTLVEMTGPVEVCGALVTAVPIHHGARLIFGYRVGGLAYLTDCSAVPEESLPLLQGLDTLVVGAIRHDPHPRHFTVAQALELIERLRPRAAWITHISHRLDHEPTNAALPSNVRLAYDGLETEIPD